jgi:hypothetical protein
MIQGGHGWRLENHDQQKSMSRYKSLGYNDLVVIMSNCTKSSKVIFSPFKAKN